MQNLDSSPNTAPQHEAIPIPDQELSSDEGHSLLLETEDPRISRQFQEILFHSTTPQLASLLSKTETLRLLSVYPEIVGNLHPIMDIDCLVEQVERLYTAQDSELDASRGNIMQMDRDDIDILSIIYTIALIGETNGQSRMGQLLYQTVEDNLQTKITGPETNTQSVVLQILAVRFHILFVVQAQKLNHS